MGWACSAYGERRVVYRILVGKPEGKRPLGRPRLKWEDGVFKKTEISNIMKIRPVGAELFHADGQKGGKTDRRTDMTKLIVGFHNFVHTPGNSAFCPQSAFLCCNGSQNTQHFCAVTVLRTHSIYVL